MPGKIIGRRTYLHAEMLSALNESRREVWEQAVTQAEHAAGVERGEQFNVLRLDADSQLALLHYPNLWCRSADSHELWVRALAPDRDHVARPKRAFAAAENRHRCFLEGLTQATAINRAVALH
jgi:hypothetical protein